MQQTPLSNDEPAAPTPVADTPPAAPAIAELSPAACAARLAELFPALFATSAPQPLKLRIQADIQQRAPGIFTKKSLSIFLHRHTTATAYLRAVANAPQRIDLDGQPAGEIAEEHRQAAVAELERRRALHDARRDAERNAQRAANDEARRARAAEEEQRREASGLLRAFETTTLTRANFCALKGLTEAQLDTMLAQARLAPPSPRIESRPAEPRGPRPPQEHRQQQQPGARQRPPPNRRPSR
ncbi:MAG: ProQ/FinO family protein [Burkholderiales bacterium]